jgi:hypothetical protein
LFDSKGVDVALIFSFNVKAPAIVEYVEEVVLGKGFTEK